MAVEFWATAAHITCEVTQESSKGSDIEEKIIWGVHDSFQEFGVNFTTHSCSHPDAKVPPHNYNETIKLSEAKEFQEVT